MSWVTDIYAGIQKIVLIEERIDNLTERVASMSASEVELDRRLVRLEAKFELLERMAGSSRRSLPEKSEK